MELPQIAKDNLKQLGYEIEPVESGELFDMVPSIGYEAFGFGTTYEDGSKGVLMTLPEDKNKYNDGIYMLRKLDGGQIVMEVIVPNSKDKGNLIMTLSDDITNHATGLDMSDIEIFDQAELWGFTLANAVVKPLAKSMFPEDKAKQERFVMLYMPRFLSNIAHMYAGDDKLFEEGVNSEPYVVKMMIDQYTKEDGSFEPDVDKGTSESVTKDED